MDCNLESCVAVLSRTGNFLHQTPESLSSRALVSPELSALQDSWAFDSRGPLVDLVQNAEAGAALHQLHQRIESAREGGQLQFGNAADFIRRILTVPVAMQDLYRHSTVSVSSKVTDINVDVKNGYVVTLASGALIQASAVILAAPLPALNFSVVLGTDMDPNFCGVNSVSLAEIFAQLAFASPQMEKVFKQSRYVFPPPLRWFQHLKGSGFCCAVSCGHEAEQLVQLHRSGTLTHFLQKELNRFFGPAVVTVKMCELYFWKGARHYWKPGQAPEFSTHAEAGLFFCGESVADPVSQGWLEGAVKTAELVVPEVVKFWYGTNCPLNSKLSNSGQMYSSHLNSKRFIVWSKEEFIRRLSKKGGVLTLPYRDCAACAPGFILVHRHVIDVSWLLYHWPRNLIPDRIFHVQKQLTKLAPDSFEFFDLLDMTADFRPVQIHSNDFGWLLKNAVAIVGR